GRGALPLDPLVAISVRIALHMAGRTQAEMGREAGQPFIRGARHHPLARRARGGGVHIESEWQVVADHLDRVVDHIAPEDGRGTSGLPVNGAATGRVAESRLQPDTVANLAVDD